MRAKPGRKPFENRESVRTTHVTIKLSNIERTLLEQLVDQRRREHEESGKRGIFTVSAYVRELVMKDARRRRVAVS
jgi:hypothetical protein